MTTPPAPPPEPQPGPAPQPQPPQQQAEAPQPQAAPAPGGEADTAGELRTALRRERDKTKTLEARISQLEQAAMTDQEKAVAKARAEGRAEAKAEHAARLAAVEFRAAAAGRIADPAAALELLDVSKLLGRDGEPDQKLIAAAVDRLAAPPPEAGNGQPRVPAGPRGAQPPGSEDFIRGVLRGPRP